MKTPLGCLTECHRHSRKKLHTNLIATCTSPICTSLVPTSLNYAPRVLYRRLTSRKSLKLQPDIVQSRTTCSIAKPNPTDSHLSSSRTRCHGSGCRSPDPCRAITAFPSRIVPRMHMPYFPSSLRLCVRPFFFDNTAPAQVPRIAGHTFQSRAPMCFFHTALQPPTRHTRIRALFCLPLTSRQDLGPWTADFPIFAETRTSRLSIPQSREPF